MKLKVNLQIATTIKKLPKKSEFNRWIKLVLGLQEINDPIEITIRLVDAEEMQTLNYYYRGKNYATNILSFPFIPPAGITTPLLGDLVICAPVVQEEAKQQKKLLIAHWAHLTIHGTLHLLGYEHETIKTAKVMESLEVKYLANLGFTNPYTLN